MIIECSKQQTFQDRGKVNFLVLGSLASDQTDILEKEKRRRLEFEQTNIRARCLQVIILIINASFALSRQLLVHCVTLGHFLCTRAYNSVIRPRLTQSDSNQ